jgi:uncharacterized protein YndB with AHSA1/START domain
MPSIRHRVGIAAPQTHVYDALATQAGLSAWWTRDVDGNPDRGGMLRFFFGGPEPAAVMEVIDLAPPQHVAWQCVQGPDEWVGTRLTFELKPAEDRDGETVLLFTHADWREPIEFMYHCSTKWAYFLLGLKAGLEGREAAPYPNDEPVSSWG